MMSSFRRPRGVVFAGGIIVQCGLLKEGMFECVYMFPTYRGNGLWLCVEGLRYCAPLGELTVVTNRPRLMTLERPLAYERLSLFVHKHEAVPLIP